MPVVSRVSFDCDVALGAKIEAASAARGMSKSQFCREVLRKFLDRVPKPRATPPPQTLDDKWQGLYGETQNSTLETEAAVSDASETVPETNDNADA